MNIGAIRKSRALKRAAAITVLGTAPVLILSAPAFAATGTAKVGNTIQVNAANNRANNVTIRHIGAFFFITDTGDVPAAGAGCVVSGVRTVRCSDANVARLVVNTGNLNDRVNNLTSTRSTQNGGPGIDTLQGGTNADLLLGGFGTDFLEGRAGADTARALNVNDGRDRFSGGPGVDTTDYQLRNARVVVTLNGVANDGAPGELDNNLTDVENILGSRANDNLTGNSSANSISGLGGSDVMTGLRGNDRLFGGTGNDTSVSLGVRDGADRYSGGPGVDTTNYAARPIAVTVTLNNVANDGSAPEFDNNLTDVENVIGGGGADNLTGSGAANRMLGLGGADVIRGGGARDTIIGGPGSDRLFGDAGNDVLNSADGVRGNDRNNGGVGNDQCNADLLDIKISC
jgi:Ca2+-binding RTX toxin-like protein